MAELDCLRQLFLAHFRSQTPAVQALLERETAAVHQAFEDYRRFIEMCAHLIDEEEPEWDVPLINLRLANTRLSLALLRFRDCTLSESGPTTHPGINHLLSVREGERRFFDAVWEEEMIRARGALEELDQESPLGSELYAFNLNYLSLLEDIPMGSEKLAPWFGELEFLGHGYAPLDIDYFSRHFGEGPTSLGWLNLVIQGAWQVGQGLLHPKLFYRCLSVSKEQLEVMLDRHHIYFQSLATGAPERAPAGQGAEILASLGRVIDEFIDWTDSGSAPPEALVNRAIALEKELDEVSQELWILSDAEVLHRPGAPGGLAELLKEAAASSLNGVADAAHLRDLVKQSRAVWEEAVRQGDFKPKRMARNDLQQVEALQGEYRAALEGFGQALEFLELLAESPSPAAREQAIGELDGAVIRLEEVCARLQAGSP